jgi:hypothetical protein
VTGSVSDCGLGGNVAEILAGIRRKGVKLWSQDGQLRYRAPKGVLSSEDIDTLRGLGDQIAMLLEQASGRGVVSNIQPRQSSERIPLTYSQLKYWQSERLDERLCRRSVALATRLQGRLDLGLLSDSVAETVRRHESLRTTITVADGAPTQRIAECSANRVRVESLTALPESCRAAQLERLIHEVIGAPVRLSEGPLFDACVIKVDEYDHVLVAAMEHIISDGYSLNIFSKDLLAAYMQAQRGSAMSLPKLGVQLADYAIWQKKTQEAWVAQHGSYWAERLAGCARLTFPDDALAAPEAPGWGTVPFVIKGDLRAELLSWSRHRRTTLTMAVFTAFVAVVLRWCGVSEGVIRYQTDGRFSPLIEDSIGYFAAVLNLHMELAENDTFLDLLSRVTHEYCRGQEHADFSYIDAQWPRPPFSRGPGFNWIPKKPQGVLTPTPGIGEELVFRPVPFRSRPDPAYELQDEPFVVLHDKDDVIEGSAAFSPKRVSDASIRRFCSNLLFFIETMVRLPEQPVSRIAIKG